MVFLLNLLVKCSPLVTKVGLKDFVVVYKGINGYSQHVTSYVNYDRALCVDLAGRSHNKI